MSTLLELCPRCEASILKRVEVAHDIDVSGSVVRLPKVQAEECPACGFRSLSGREVRLFDVLFAPQYGTIRELIAALRTAGYVGMFLRQDRTESALAFGSRSYVRELDDGVRDLYLDNESSHVIEGLGAVGEGWVPVELASRRLTVKLPRLGEGENGIVYDVKEADDSVLKLAKPRPYSRNHLREEHEFTEFFASHGIPVPEIVDADPHGSFMIKKRLAGESLARVYETLGPPDAPLHRLVRATTERFIARLLELFVTHPEVKTSVSPNNIFVLLEDSTCRCLLVDTGPAPLHDYSRFSFAEYWETTIPQKIRQYRAVGYL